MVARRELELLEADALHAVSLWQRELRVCLDAARREFDRAIAADPEGSAALLASADEAMYHVKASERGGVFAAVSPKPPERTGTLTAGVSSEP